MALIDWNDDFSVKVKSIDQQHKKLLGLINDLHSAMKQGKGKNAVNKIVHEVIVYTQIHFSHEEDLMKKLAYPDYLKHKAQHDALVKQVTDIEENLNAGKVVLSQDVLTFLKKWLIEHILDSDKNYSAYFNSNGIY